MDIVRNFINISGLAEADELPNNIGGQVIQYSETETIFIPENQPEVKSLFNILIKVEKKSIRSIPVPSGKTIVVDGVKKIKIIYTQKDDSGSANFVDLELPYNTFVELPGNAELENVNIYLLDAFFSLVDDRRIYSHFVYLVNVTLKSNVRKKIDKKPPQSDYEPLGKKSAVYESTEDEFSESEIEQSFPVKANENNLIIVNNPAKSQVK